MKGEREKVVLCLEDAESRVKFLREIAKSYGATVYYATRVKEFLMLCSLHSRADVKAIVLDHDLGDQMPSTDTDGLDGLDAAEQMPLIVAPVLIWSLNESGAPRMQQVLRARGFDPVLQIPFIGYRNEIAKHLRGWLVKT